MATLTGYKTDRVGAFIEKDPFAQLDYSLDFSNYLPTGDTINTVSVSVDSGITVVSTSNTDTVATAIISGGTAGSIYNVESQLQTHYRIQEILELKY